MPSRFSRLDDAEALLSDFSPVVRSAAVWALRQLLAPAEFASLASRRSGAESDEDVRTEWRHGADAELS